jgi:hypothetical protein
VSDETRIYLMTRREDADLDQPGFRFVECDSTDDLPPDARYDRWGILGAIKFLFYATPDAPIWGRAFVVQSFIDDWAETHLVKGDDSDRRSQ